MCIAAIEPDRESLEATTTEACSILQSMLRNKGSLCNEKPMHPN